MSNKVFALSKKIKSALSPIIGAQAENQAKHYLIGEGLLFKEQNYRCRLGEIDLIMLDKEQWVFVEVKYRSSEQYGKAVDYMTASKRKKIEAAIYHYMKCKNMNPHHCDYRCDLVCIDSGNISWLKAI
jgi:putative endonuclease